MIAEIQKMLYAIMLISSQFILENFMQKCADKFDISIIFLSLIYVKALSIFCENFTKMFIFLTVFVKSKNSTIELFQFFHTYLCMYINECLYQIDFTSIICIRKFKNIIIT